MSSFADAGLPVAPPLDSPFPDPADDPSPLPVALVSMAARAQAESSEDEPEGMSQDSLVQPPLSFDVDPADLDVAESTLVIEEVPAAADEFPVGASVPPVVVEEVEPVAATSFKMSTVAVLPVEEGEAPQPPRDCPFIEVAAEFRLPIPFLRNVAKELAEKDLLNEEVRHYRISIGIEPQPESLGDE